MKDPFVARTLKEVDQNRIHDSVFYLAANPLPMRKVNLTMPDHVKSTLEEADDYLAQRLEESGYTVTVQAIYYVFVLYLFFALIYDFGQAGYVFTVASNAARMAAQDAAKNIDEDIFVIDQEVRFVSRPKQIVIHPERFLVCADEEEGEIIRFGIDAVQLERLFDIAQIHKFVDLAIGIAGDVAQSPALRRLLRQASDRNDGKQLIQRPAIGSGLEYGEVADVLVA